MPPNLSLPVMVASVHVLQVPQQDPTALGAAPLPGVLAKAESGPDLRIAQAGDFAAIQTGPENWAGLFMAHRVLTEIAVSITDHKKNPMATVEAGKGMAVAVLNHNEPAFYCVPAKAYEELMDLVDDLELGRLADARLADGQEPVRVSLDAP